MNMDLSRFGHLPAQLRAALKKHTGGDWILNISSDTAGRTIADNKQEELSKKLNKAKDDPFLTDILKNFPNATLTLMEQNYARN
jgi:hypothetical protein